MKFANQVREAAEKRSIRNKPEDAITERDHLMYEEPATSIKIVSGAIGVTSG